MSFKKILLLFFIWRFIDFLIIILAKQFIPYLGFFPYQQDLAKYHLPSFFSSLANFDGVHYLRISEKGYDTHEQVFFPLFPLLIRFLSPLFAKNYLLTGLFLSNLSFLFGLYFFSLTLKLYQLKKQAIFLTLLFLLSFPTSFFFGACYTEGLFFFLSTITLFFLKKRNYLSAAFFCFLSSLTRLVGVFLFIPFLLAVLTKERKTHFLKKVFFVFLSFFSFFGLFAYSFYLWQKNQNPFLFFTSQKVFAGRTTYLIFLPQVLLRYLKIFFTASFNFQYLIALIEFLLFIFVFLTLILDLKQSIKNLSFLALNIFSFTNLILPTLTGTLSSIPRYSLLSFSFFIFWGKVEKKSWLISLLILFFILHLFFLGFFVQGYFVS
jgi:hypothetical protein